MTTLRQVMASRVLDAKLATRFALGDEQQRASNGQFGSGGGTSSGGGSKEEKRIASLPSKSDPGYNAAVAKSLGIKSESAGGGKEAKRIASLPPKSDPGYNAAVAKSLGIKPESKKAEKTRESLRVSSLPPKSDPGYNAAVAKSLGIKHDSEDDQQRATNGQFGSGGGTAKPNKAAKSINKQVKKADPGGAAASAAYKAKYAKEIAAETSHAEKMGVRASKERLKTEQENHEERFLR